MSHRQPMGQTKETSLGMAGVTVAALIVGALIAWLTVDQAIGSPKVVGAAEKRPALFLANESLPPMNFMKHGKPTGIVVDLVEAMAARMHRPVEIQLMNWTKAQQLVLDGRADALLQMDPNPERLKIYDFSNPLLNTEFTIFTSGERLGVASISNLRGLKVGVEEKGLPILLLQGFPQIIVKIIPDFVQGFRMLATGALDAVVADRWVGSYVLAENNIRGVKLIEEPIGRSHSAIAVKKGNPNLLGDIDAALADIRRDGTYDKIIESWRSKEVVFKTREQLRQQAWWFVAISVALIAALFSIAALVMEIRRRKRAEQGLRESESRLDLALRSSEMGVWYLDLVENKRFFDDQVSHLLGLDPGKFTGKGEEFFNAVHPQDREAVKLALARTIEDGVPYEPEFRAIWPDGSIHYLASRGKLVHDNEGRPLRLNGLIWDITERKQAERILLESEERLSAILEHMPVGVWIVDSTGRVTLKNKATDLIWAGNSPLSSRPENYVEYVAWDVKTGERLKTEDYPLTRALRTGLPIAPVELRIRRFDGKEGFIMMSTALLRGPDGSLTGAVGINVDITGRQQAEAALRESEGRYRMLHETLRDAFVQVTMDGRIVECNDIFCRMLGYAPEEIRRLTFQQLTPARWQAFEADLVREQIIPRGYSDVYEKEYQRQDGTIFPVELRTVLFRDAAGQPDTMWAIVRDITERKQAEAELQQTREQLAEGQRIAHLGSWEYLAATQTTVWSDEQKRIYGLDQAQSSPDYEVMLRHHIHPDDAAELDRNFREALQHRALFENETRIIRPDGTVRWIYNKAQPYFDEHGKLLRYIGTTLDITERKRAEMALRQRTAELEFANRELEAFSYSVSHDLKAPIRAIQGFARMLVKERAGALDEEGLRLLGVVVDNTQTMAQLIDDLLALSRLGRQQIRKSAFDLAAMVRWDFEQQRAVAPGRDICLTVGELPPAWADHSLINQVILNLLENAIKYTRAKETAGIEVGGYVQGPETVYYVRDNGIGFDERFSNKLFGVFQRLHRGSEYEGTGVGLAIVKRIIERHGGRVWAEGKVNEGATFYFALPKN